MKCATTKRLWRKYPNSDCGTVKKSYLFLISQYRAPIPTRNGTAYCMPPHRDDSPSGAPTACQPNVPGGQPRVDWFSGM